MVDPNIRAALIEDRAGYLARLRVLPQTDVLKLSVEDAAWLSPATADAAARGLLDHGPRIVLLTAVPTARPSSRHGKMTHVPAVPVEVVDTIGAGDAFSAGFLTRWLREGGGAPAAVLEATAFAVRVAGLACSVRGATPPANVLDRLPQGLPPTVPGSPSATAP